MKNNTKKMLQRAAKVIGLQDKKNSSDSNKTTIFIEVLGMDKIWEETINTGLLEEILEHKDITNYTQDPKSGAHTFTFYLEEVSWSTRSGKSAACCAFNATKTFLQNNLGRNLDEDDRRWYMNHPGTVTAGLKERTAFNTLNALVEPYKVRISHIILKKGQSILESEEWYRILGMNAMSALNPNVTHEEYIETVAGNIPELKQHLESNLPRIMISDTVTGPAVIFNGAFGGGHASYIGPRNTTGGFRYACRYEIIDSTNQELLELPIYRYTSEDSRTPEFLYCKFNGKTLNTHNIKTWKYNNFNSSFRNSYSASTSYEPSPFGSYYPDEYYDSYISAPSHKKSSNSSLAKVTNEVATIDKPDIVFKDVFIGLRDFASLSGMDMEHYNDYIETESKATEDGQKVVEKLLTELVSNSTIDEILEVCVDVGLADFDEDTLPYFVTEEVFEEAKSLLSKLASNSDLYKASLKDLASVYNSNFANSKVKVGLLLLVQEHSKLN